MVSPGASPAVLVNWRNCDCDEGIAFCGSAGWAMMMEAERTKRQDTDENRSVRKIDEPLSSIPLPLQSRGEDGETARENLARKCAFPRPGRVHARA